MFPFFPLPADFDHLDGESWQRLSQDIYACLVQYEYVEGRRQTLMREFFWMSFMAAFPAFPYCDWPDLDPPIPTEGNFILHWMQNLDLACAVSYHGNFSNVREIVWEELVAAVRHHFRLNMAH